MLIEIAGPIFKCEEDKNVFFSRLYGLPSFDSVMSQGVGLLLTLNDNSTDELIDRINEICNMWGTAFKVLKE